MEDLSDRELMVMFKHGRREAFEVLFARYRDHVWSYLRGVPVHPCQELIDWTE